jgi:hypothetical protein
MERVLAVDVTALADELLVEWYFWSSGYRPDLDMPGCAPACRDSTSSRQFDTTTEITRDLCDRLDMEAVQYCYDAISFPFQNAIGIEMRNRQVKVRVWRSVMGKTYEEAVAEIIPHMHKKNLL